MRLRRVQPLGKPVVVCLHLLLERELLGLAAISRRLLRECLTMRPYYVLSGVLLLAAPAAGQTIEVTKVEFVHTRTDATTGVTSTLEEGTYQIAPDGVYRVDRLNKATGKRSATIEDSGRRTTLDADRREARVEASNIIPQGTPSVWQEIDTQRVDLGTKQAGGLTLRGYRFTSVLAGPRGQIVHHN